MMRQCNYVVVAANFSKTSSCKCTCVRIMAWYSELSAAVRHWSDSESLSSNHVVADMFDSASGIVAAIGSKLLLFNQV